MAEQYGDMIDEWIWLSNLTFRLLIGLFDSSLGVLNLCWLNVWGGGGGNGGGGDESSRVEWWWCWLLLLVLLQLESVESFGGWRLGGRPGLDLQFI